MGSLESWLVGDIRKWCIGAPAKREIEAVGVLMEEEEGGGMDKCERCGSCVEL